MMDEYHVLKCHDCGWSFRAESKRRRLCEECKHRRWKAVQARSALRRKEKDEILRSCGLVKVKGALGGTYWE